jgi:hypothetical protein
MQQKTASCETSITLSIFWGSPTSIFNTQNFSPAANATDAQLDEIGAKETALPLGVLQASSQAIENKPRPGGRGGGRKNSLKNWGGCRQGRGTSFYEAKNETGSIGRFLAAEFLAAYRQFFNSPQAVEFFKAIRESPARL